MCTSFEAVKDIINGITNKDNVWNVNTENEYQESGSAEAPIDKTEAASKPTENEID